jgi:uncharacterized protein (DUF433 family)
MGRERIIRQYYDKIMPLASLIALIPLTEKLNGQPCIRNLRLSVRRVIELLAIYPDRQELFREFPRLEEEDIRQAVEFSSDRQKIRVG